MILFALSTIPSRANLGETVEQCVARYGRPLGFSEASKTSPFGTLVFTASGYTLVVFLINTKEVGARVTKLDKSAFTADSTGTPWTPTTSDDPTCLQWIRADKATVLYDKAKHALLFSSEEMADAVKASKVKSGAGN
jgi:hypothetical protein